MRVALAGALWLTLCLLPAAHAAGSWGRLDCSIASFGGSIRATGPFEAAYQSPLNTGAAIAFHAQSVEVTRYERDGKGVSPLIVRTDTYSVNYTLHDVDGVLAGGKAEGWAGFRLDRADARLAAARLDLSAGAQPSVGSHVPGENAEGPEADYFYHQGVGSALYGLANGTLTAKGDLSLKASGATVVLSARENRTSLATGHTDQDLLHSDVWVVLEMRNATLDVERAPTMEVLAPRATVAWEGSLGVACEGIAPLSPDPSGAWRLQLEPRIQGDAVSIASTSVRETGHGGLALPVGGGGGSGISLLLVGAVVAAGGGAALILRARRGLRREIAVNMTAAACLEEAHNAQRARDPVRALAWAKRAAKAAPEDQGVALELAWHLDNAGRPTEARRAYERALPLGPPTNGNAHMEFAIFMAKRFRDAARAEDLAIEALRRDPTLLSELFLVEGALRVLSGRPRFEEAVRRAECSETVEQP